MSRDYILLECKAMVFELYLNIDGQQQVPLLQTIIPLLLHRKERIGQRQQAACREPQSNQRPLA